MLIKTQKNVTLNKDLLNGTWHVNFYKLSLF